MADVKKVVELEIDVDTGDVKQLNRDIKETAETTQKAKEETKGFGKSLFTVGNAIKGMALGAAIAGFAKLKDVLSQNQRIADELARSTSSLEIVFNKLIGSIVPDGEGFSITGFFKGLVSGLGGVNIELEIAERAAERIVENRKLLGRLEIETRRLQLLNQTDAEIQRQLRDDTRLSFDERIKANSELAKILEKSTLQEQAVVEKRIAALEFEQKALGFSEERYQQILALEVELVDINERILGFKSEQQMAEQALHRERKAAHDELMRQKDEEAQANADEISAITERLISQTEREENRKRESEEKRYQEALERQRTHDDISLQIMMAGIDRELALSAAKYDKLYEQAEGNKELQLAIIEAQEREASEIIDFHNQEQVQRKQDVFNEIANMSRDYLRGFAALNDAFTAKSQADAKRQFRINKALRLGEAIIAGVQGTVNAFTANSPSPMTAATLGAWPYIQAGAAATFAAGNIATIAATQFNGGGGGGGMATASRSAPSTTSAIPSFDTIGSSGTNQLSEAIASQNNQPMRAYVVANDVNSAQSLERNRQSNATFP